MDGRVQAVPTKNTKPKTKVKHRHLRGRFSMPRKHFFPYGHDVLEELDRFSDLSICLVCPWERVLRCYSRRMILRQHLFLYCHDLLESFRDGEGDKLWRHCGSGEKAREAGNGGSEPRAEKTCAEREAGRFCGTGVGERPARDSKNRACKLFVRLCRFDSGSDSVLLLIIHIVVIEKCTIRQPRVARRQC